MESRHVKKMVLDPLFGYKSTVLSQYSNISTWEMKWLCGKLSSLSEGQDTLKRVCVFKWSCVPERPAVFLRNSLLYPLCSVTQQHISHDFLSDSGIVVLRSHLGNIFLNFHCESFARREKLSHEHCSVSCPSCNNAGALIEISGLLRIRVHDLDTPCLCEKFLSLSRRSFEIPQLIEECGRLSGLHCKMYCRNTDCTHTGQGMWLL